MLVQSQSLDVIQSDRFEVIHVRCHIFVSTVIFIEFLFSSSLEVPVYGVPGKGWAVQCLCSKGVLAVAGPECHFSQVGQMSHKFECYV